MMVIVILRVQRLDARFTAVRDCTIQYIIRPFDERKMTLDRFQKCIRLSKLLDKVVYVLQYLRLMKDAKEPSPRNLTAL